MTPRGECLDDGALGGRLEEADHGRLGLKPRYVLQARRLDREHHVGRAQHGAPVSLDRHADLAVGVVGEAGLLARARLHDYLETGCGEPDRHVRHQGDAPLALVGLRNHPDLHEMKL